MLLPQLFDTTEVSEAKAAFFAAFEAEASRTKRSDQLGVFGPTTYAGLAAGSYSGVYGAFWICWSICVTLTTYGYTGVFPGLFPAAPVDL